MRRTVIAANWKMNTTPLEGVSLIQNIFEKLGILKKNIDVVLCPPMTHLSQLGNILHERPEIQLGSQNVHWEESGAFTGEVSANMLKECNCKWVIVGHSERRQLFGETDEKVNKRLLKALEHGLKPIVCIGETLEQRESNETFHVLTNQLEWVFKDVLTNEDDMQFVNNATDIVIAYEPVWAIGTGVTATKEQAEEVHLFIRKFITDRFGKSFADNIAIIYGGSVNEKNATELLSMPNVDGALVGGASLNASQFKNIVNAV